MSDGEIGIHKNYVQEGLNVLYLVNTTPSPVRTIRSLLPVYDIKMKLRPDFKSLGNYRVLPSQGDLSVKTNETGINLQVIRLDDFCALAIQINLYIGSGYQNDVLYGSN